MFKFVRELLLLLESSMRRGISAVLATAILLTVVIGVAVAYALWFKGVVGAAGYGTRPVRLGIEDFRVLGPIAIFRIHNIGSDTVYIDTLLINDREVEVMTAYDVASKDLRLMEEDGQTVIVVNPGEMVEVWVLNPEGDFEPDVSYRVLVATTLGFEASKIVKAHRAMIVEPKVEIYIKNRGLTYKVDLVRLRWEIYEGSPESPGNVLWSGRLRFVEDREVRIREMPEFKQQPIITVRNPLAGKGEEYVIWMDHNEVSYEYGSGYYRLDPVDGAVPRLDFILFFEDLWRPGSAGDADYNEHVTRVTWRVDGSVRAAVYFGAHGFTFDVYIGGKYAYQVGGSHWQEPGKCTYCNILSKDYNGDDLRGAIQEKIYFIKP